MHSAQLICNSDRSVSSDVMQAPTVAEAKKSAEQNYHAKYNANRNWQRQWTTFAALLADSAYKTA